MFRYSFTAVNKFFLFLFSLIFLEGINAQQLQLSKLLQDLESLKDDTNKINTLLNIVELQEICDQQNMKVYAEEALELSEKLKYKQGVAQSCIWLSQDQWYKNNYTETKKYGDRALEIATELKDKNIESSALSLIGWSYLSDGYSDKALSYFQKVTEMPEEATNKKYLIRSHMALGSLYKMTGDKERASKHKDYYYQLALKYNDQQEIAHALAGAGGELLSKDNIEGLSKINQSLKISLAIGDKLNTRNCYMTLGQYYERKNKLDLACQNYLNAYLYSSYLNNPRYRSFSLASLGYVKYFQGKEDSAFYFTKYAYNIADSSKDFPSLRFSSATLSDLYLESKDFENAYKHFVIYKNYADSIQLKNNIIELSKLQLKYEESKREELNKKDKEQKNMVIIFGSILLVFVIVVAVISLFSLKKIRVQKRVIEQKSIETEYQKHIIEDKQKEIIDSINYAKKIQYTLLANNDLMRANLGEHFVLFQPKDIVSGDFYWASLKGQKFYFAVCDSTGHGVPGAFMSLLNISFLNEAVNEKGIIHPNDILDFVKQRLIDNVSKDGQKDGFDGIILCFDKETKAITYAAANNAPIIVSKKELKELAKDRMPVGAGEKSDKFTLNKIDYEKGDVLYLYTDGYADQFGGSKGKKYKYKQLNELLATNSKNEFKLQHELLLNEFHNWKGKLDQIDDVLIVGICL